MMRRCVCRLLGHRWVRLTQGWNGKSWETVDRCTRCDAGLIGLAPEWDNYPATPARIIEAMERA